MIKVKENLCSLLDLKTHPLFQQLGTGNEGDTLYDPCPLQVCIEKQTSKKNRNVAPSNKKKTVLRVIDICYPEPVHPLRPVDFH